MFYFLYWLATTLKPNTGGGYGGSGRVGSVPSLLGTSPDTLVASDLERIVINWLNKRGIIDYDFQSSLLGGRYELGGSIIDILFPDRSLAWRIQGDYWHKQIAKQATDSVQRELLESQGWKVVDIWGSTLDTPTRIEETLRKALMGVEML